MEDWEIQELKKELANHIRNDVSKMIATKRLPAQYSGGSCGTSLHGEDSIYINLDVKVKNKKVRIYVIFEKNVNKLFDPTFFKGTDNRGKIDINKYINNPVNLARLRILRSVYEVIERSQDTQHNSWGDYKEGSFIVNAFVRETDSWGDKSSNRIIYSQKHL